MSKVAIISDSEAIFGQVSAFLQGNDIVFHVKRGDRAVSEAAGTDLVICDMQISNMGGIAVCYEFKHESEAGRIQKPRIVLLLDREADRFLAKQAEADAYIVKPIDALELNRAISNLLVG